MQHILFPFDFSNDGRDTARFVRAFALEFGARLTVLSVLPPAFEHVPPDMVTAPLQTADDVEPSKQEIQRRLDASLQNEFAGVHVDRVADCGDPARRIIHFAECRGVDLIMMPTHGIGAVRSFFVGSVTTKVLHDARCPVWTATHGDYNQPSERPRTIVCAVDGSPAAGAVARWADRLAARFGAHLELLHVVEPVSDWPSLERERRLQEQVRHAAEERVSAMAKGAGVAAPLRVIVGTVAQTAADEAAAEHADLMIIGRGLLSEPFGRLRTHAYGIIQRAPCPVVSV